MDTKFPHAVWAAGRGLIALLLPNFDVVDNIWLEPLSWQVCPLCHYVFRSLKVKNYKTCSMYKFCGQIMLTIIIYGT